MAKAHIAFGKVSYKYSGSISKGFIMDVNAL